MREAASVVVKRHYRELSAEETDELVASIADLIVGFLKHRRDPAVSAKHRLERGDGSGGVGPSTRERVR